MISTAAIASSDGSGKQKLESKTLYKKNRYLLKDNGSTKFNKSIYCAMSLPACIILPLPVI
jgi:hypothetical protein